MEGNESLKNDHHLAIALEIDRVASQDKYFQERKLCANADLFLSFAYKAMYVTCPTSGQTSRLLYANVNVDHTGAFLLTLSSP